MHGTQSANTYGLRVATIFYAWRSGHMLIIWRNAGAAITNCESKIVPFRPGQNMFYPKNNYV